LSAGFAYGVAKQFGHAGGIFTKGVNTGKALLKATAHALSRGAISVAQGGTFKSGFASGFASSFFSPGTSLGGDGAGGFTVRTTIAGVVGGTASEIGGGKFSNGAISGAFVHMFNAEAVKINADKANYESLKALSVEIQKVKNMNLDDFNKYVKYGFDEITTAEDFFIAKNHVLAELNIMLNQHTSIVTLYAIRTKKIWDAIVKSVGLYESKDYYIGYACTGAADNCSVSGVYYDK